MAVFGMHIDLVDRPLSMKIGDTGKLKKMDSDQRESGRDRSPVFLLVHAVKLNICSSAKIPDRAIDPQGTYLQ